MVGSITSLGIGSGIDSQSIVDQLVAAERGPREARLDRREDFARAQLSAFGQLASAIDSLGRSAGDLGLIQTSRRTTVSDESQLSVSVSDDATLGNFSVQVTQLARAQSLASAEFADADATVGSGTLSITVGSTTTQVSIAEGSDSLADIRDAINEADAGVNAVVVDNGNGGVQLLLTANDTGLENGIQIAVDDDDGDDTDAGGLSALSYLDGGAQNLSEQQSARNATVLFNGLPVSSASNVFEDIVPGVTLTALSEGDAAARVTTAEDRSGATNLVRSFVAALDVLGRFISTQTDYNPDTGEAGLLQGDASVRPLESRLRTELFAELGEGTYNNLLSLGIEAGDDGAFSVDTTRLAAALEDDFDAVASTLAAAGERFSEIAESFGGSGLIGARTEGLESRLSSIAEERESLESRMEATETRIRNQFAALDTLVAELQTTGQFLSTQLENIASISMRER